MLDVASQNPITNHQAYIKILSQVKDWVQKLVKNNRLSDYQTAPSSYEEPFFIGDYAEKQFSSPQFQSSRSSHISTVTVQNNYFDVAYPYCFRSTQINI
ncbi:MAG: hypothetical protein BVN30_03445 [Proteobacteria bacterium ST_bin16]|nr:MAG: hypothetical protein BVN30_03445 [Proteobacteria bacterium ST_bin16]